MIRKFLFSVLITLSLFGCSQDGGNKVKADVDVAHCVLTGSGGFFCEGNPGYEEAYADFLRNKK